MKRLIAFDLDGTLAESKQPIDQETAELLAKLLDLVDVAVISGGDWPQFEAQVVSRLPIRADLRQLFIMPTTGTKLYRFTDVWKPVYADVFDPDERRRILQAFELAPREVGLPDERTWGERIEDRGSQIRGRLREGAESYAKDLGQRYSPVRLMCSHPNGETWASRSGAIWVPLAARVLTTSPSFMVFQNMMMAASRFIPAMR